MKSIQRATGDLSQRQSLLIIDDDKDWTDLLKVYFFEKYDVQVFNSACEAIETISKQRPSIIILDLVMPTIDGFGIIRRINDSSQARIPTIMITGWHTQEVEECATSVGCFAVLSKPVDLDVLDQTVSFVINRRRAASTAIM